MEIAIAGDWHGHTEWAVEAIDLLAKLEITEIIQVGDFGIWPGDEGDAHLNAVAEACARNGTTLRIVPGNHEDYSQIHDPEGPEVPPAQVLRFGDGWDILVLPRGYQWEMDGKKMLALGGAASIDWKQRAEGKSWWPEEMFRDCDMDRVERIAEGDQIDVMFAHESPAGGTRAVENILNSGNRFYGWDYEYAHKSTEWMTEAVAKINPNMFVHGHMHVVDERFDENVSTHYVSLGMNGDIGNIAVLHTDTMQIEWFNE